MPFEFILKRTAPNMRFSAMLAEEYILIDISLSAALWCDFSSQHHLKFIQHRFLYLSLVTELTNHGISAQQKALTVSCDFTIRRQ
jgi:hypothetical protein